MKLHHMSACELRRALDQGEVSSREIVDALIARRREVDPAVRAFVVELDAEARDQADRADRERKDGSARGLLHGMPITIKENIDLRGHDSTMGLRHRQGQPAKADAVTVGVLREQGAIALGKTNVPQLLLAQESENVIWGITHNPWSLQRSPGGSSGGEGAAIASGQSPWGIGTDIGGSIRIPCHFCGIAGLKPTVDRWSNRGSAGSVFGQELVRAQMGPMARRVEDLALLMRAVDPQRLAQNDPAVPPFAVADPKEVDLRGLRIGVMEDDGFLTPNPAIRRAVREAKAALQAAGATLVDYLPPHSDLIYVWLAGISADGGATLRANLGRDPVVRQLEQTFRIAKLPAAVRKMLAAVMDKTGEPRTARLLRALGEKPVAEYWRLTHARTEMRRAELDAWADAGLDAVICPPHALPAMPLGSSGELTLSLSYAFRYVMLNFPAGVVPVTRVREDEEARAHGDRLDKSCAAAERGAAGLPVGLQVVARPWREDVALAVMQAVQEGCISSPLYPHTPIDPLP
jgi:fatty acid amide hydrolase